MPRDANGDFTLEAGNPVVSGTTITASWANPTMSDIGNEITNSLDRSGRGGMLAPLTFVDGDINLPGVAFTNEPGLGFFRPSAGNLTVAAGGENTARFNTVNQAEVWRGGVWKRVADITEAAGSSTGTTFPVAPVTDGILFFNTTLERQYTYDFTAGAWIDTTSPGRDDIIITTEGDLAQGDVNGDAERLPIGAENETLTSISGKAAWVDNSPVNTLTAVALSAANVDFAIPAGVHEISMIFNQCSPSVNADWLIQIGNGSPEAAGYLSNCANLFEATAVSVGAYTTGFGIVSGFTAGKTCGIATLSLMNPASNVWAFSSNTARTENVIIQIGAGIKAITGILDIIRLTCESGVPQSGTLNVSYKFGKNV